MLYLHTGGHDVRSPSDWLHLNTAQISLVPLRLAPFVTVYVIPVLRETGVRYKRETSAREVVSPLHIPNIHQICFAV